MKMPRRPFFPGQLKSHPDIFGLHHITILGQAAESDADKKKRKDTVEKGVLAAFRAAVHHLGEDEARKTFKQVLRRPKRGKGKAHAADRDARLLKAYDAATEKNESIAALAKRLHKSEGQQLGSTPGAVETQIRKLVNARKAAKHEAKKQARSWRMATRGEATILSGTYPPVLLARNSHPALYSLGLVDRFNDITPHWFAILRRPREADSFDCLTACHQQWLGLCRVYSGDRSITLFREP